MPPSSSPAMKHSRRSSNRASSSSLTSLVLKSLSQTRPCPWSWSAATRKRLSPRSVTPWPSLRLRTLPPMTLRRRSSLSSVSWPRPWLPGKCKYFWILVSIAEGFSCILSCKSESSILTIDWKLLIWLTALSRLWPFFGVETLCYDWALSSWMNEIALGSLWFWWAWHTGGSGQILSSIFNLFFVIFFLLQIVHIRLGQTTVRSWQKNKKWFSC